MGGSIILLQYCHIIICLHERQNHWGKNVVSVFLGIKGTIYSHKLSFSIVRNSTPYHHRTPPKMICFNNACLSLTLSCTVENTRSSISMFQRKKRLICIQNLLPVSCVPVRTILAPGQTNLPMASRLLWSNVWAAWLYSSFLEASKYSLFTNLTTMMTTSLSVCACCSSLPVTKMQSSHAILLGLSLNPGPAGSREIRPMT